jgi:predicted nucleic acid-binding Zn ribbon protein
VIKEYRCSICGHVQDEWRPTSNMPDKVACKLCTCDSYRVDKIHPTGVVFKGGGWTPSSSDPVLDLGSDDE